MEARPYERFPTWIVLVSSGVSIAIYALGAAILGGLSIYVSVLYVLYCAWVEAGVLRGSCVHCYYYGKLCGLGKGKLCAWLFRKGDPQRFVERSVSWRDVVPDMLVLAFPVAGGIILLVRQFAWPVLAMLVVLAVLSLAGNALIRGSLTCKYCKQRELGCPAQTLFGGQEA
jgi:hypothetical protein